MLCDALFTQGSDLFDSTTETQGRMARVLRRLSRSVGCQLDLPGGDGLMTFVLAAPFIGICDSPEWLILQVIGL